MKRYLLKFYYIYTIKCFLHFSREIYYFLYKNHLKFVVRSKAHQTDIYTPLFRSLNTDLRLIVHHEYLDIFPCTWPKDNGERKNKQTEKKQANFCAVQTRSFENIACSRVPKNLREGYGCFYHRLSIRPSPDSHSLSYWCILVCWRGTRTTLVPSNNIVRN